MTKIIFSRKGFDSTAGGIPSIKRDKYLKSLPIPYKKKQGRNKKQCTQVEIPSESDPITFNVEHGNTEKCQAQNP